MSMLLLIWYALFMSTMMMAAKVDDEITVGHVALGLLISFPFIAIIFIGLLPLILWDQYEGIVIWKHKEKEQEKKL